MSYPGLIRSIPILALLLGIVTSCSTVVGTSLNVVPRKTVLVEDRVVLPTTVTKDGYMFVEVRINNRGPFKFLVDTGCTYPGLSQRVMDAVGLKPMEGLEFTMENAAGNNVRSQAVWLERLESGGLKLEGLVAAVEPAGAFSAFGAAIDQPLDGILGMSALSDVVLEMDFPGQIVAVAKRGATAYPKESAVSYSGQTPLVPLTLAGETRPMLIDTGFNGEMKLSSFDRLPLVFPEVPMIDLGVVFGKNSGLRSAQSQLEGEARVGPVTWMNPPLVAKPGERSSGLIGVAAFKTWKLVFDQRAQRIYFLGADLRRTWARQEGPDKTMRLIFANDIRVEELRETPRIPLQMRRAGKQSAPDFTPRQTVLSEDRVTLPTATSRGVLIVEARINGAGPFRLLVASSDRVTRVSERLVAAAGLQPMADWKLSPNPAAVTHVVRIDRFESGGLELNGLSAAVASQAAIENIAVVVGAVDGLLGMDALRDLVLEVDLPGKKIVAVRPGTANYPAERGMDYRGAGEIELEVAGTRRRAFLALESNGGIELPDLDQLPLLRPKESVDTVALSPAVERLQRGQLAGSIQAGPVTWIRPPITVKKIPRIGVSSLGIWRIVFDPGAHRVYFLDGKLERTALTPSLAPALKPGYFAWMVGPALRLAQVDAGGAFDRAGLRPSDLILAVDGKPVRVWREAGGDFSGRLQSRFKLQAQRDGVPFETELVLGREVESN